MANGAAPKLGGSRRAIPGRAYVDGSSPRDVPVLADPASHGKGELHRKSGSPGTHDTDGDTPGTSKNSQVASTDAIQSFTSGTLALSIIFGGYSEELSGQDLATGRRKKSVVLPVVEGAVKHHHMAGQRGDSGQFIWCKHKGLCQLQPSLPVRQRVGL